MTTENKYFNNGFKLWSDRNAPATNGDAHAKFISMGDLSSIFQQIALPTQSQLQDKMKEHGYQLTINDSCFGREEFGYYVKPAL